MQELVQKRCIACDYQKLKALENHPKVREWRDKIEQLNFRLTQCKSENKALKSKMQLAKKLVYEEVGGSSVDFQEMLKHGTDPGRKVRVENTLLLKRKVQELQECLNQLKGKMPATKFATREQTNKDKKLFWKMELECRLENEAAKNDLIPLLKEDNCLRKRLVSEKARFRERSEEVSLLRAKLQTQMIKNKEDMGLVKSFQTIEHQLHDIQAEKATLRRELAGFKARNKRLENEVSGLKDQLKTLFIQSNDNNMLIDSYTNKLKNIQDTIEFEKLIVKQNMDLYESEQEELDAAYESNIGILESLQNSSYQRHQILIELEKDTADGFVAYLEEYPTVEPTSLNSKGKSAVITNTIDINPTQKDENGTSPENNSEPQNVNNTNEIKKVQLEVERVKFERLNAAAEIEKERLFHFSQMQDNQMKDIAIEVNEVERLISQQNSNKKLLLQKISHLQKTRPLQRKKDIIPMPCKNNLEELQLRIGAQREENDVLRNFLQITVNNRALELSLVKQFLFDSKQFFLEALQDIIKIVNEQKESVLVEAPEISRSQENS